MKPVWTSELKSAANIEGWDIFDSGGEEYRLCRIDDPAQWMEDNKVQSVAELESDDDAWVIVLSGTQPHHVAAVSFMKYYSPEDVPDMGSSITHAEKKNQAHKMRL